MPVPVRNEYIVKVRGNTRFPIDMLRYDSAVPATEVDSGLIDDTYGIRYPMEPMTITVRMMHEPTSDRWKSFSWEVVEIEKRTQA